MTTIWTPRRRGKIYCSKACGAKCTHAAFMRATNAADRLVKRLGPHWTPRVWENMGWHYELVMGAIRLDEYPRHEGRRRVRTYQASFANSAELRVDGFSIREDALRMLELKLFAAADQLYMGVRMLRQAAREKHK